MRQRMLVQATKGASDLARGNYSVWELGLFLLAARVMKHDVRPPAEPPAGLIAVVPREPRRVWRRVLGEPIPHSFRLTQLIGRDFYKCKN